MKKSGSFLPLLIWRSLIHRPGRTAARLAALTVSATVATALLTVYASLDSKLNHEFRTFGANVVITAAGQDSRSSEGTPTELPDNALEAARHAAGSQSLVVPFAYGIAQMQSGAPIVVAGTDVKAAEQMNRWWQIHEVAAAPTDPDAATQSGAVGLVPALAGVQAKKALGSNRFKLFYGGQPLAFETSRTLQTGGAEDSRVYLPLDAFARWTGTRMTALEIQIPGSAQEVQAAIARLRKALPEAEVQPIHQLIAAQAGVASRTRSLLLSSVLLISLTISVCVLASLGASVLERRRDYAVMKAMGATERRVELLFLAEVVLLAMAGLGCGYALGSGIADLIGEINFHTSIAPLWQVAVAAAILNLTIGLIAALIPLKALRMLKPASLLQGH